jgi:hypothetical protein
MVGEAHAYLAVGELLYAHASSAGEAYLGAEQATQQWLVEAARQSLDKVDGEGEAVALGFIAHGGIPFI